MRALLEAVLYLHSRDIVHRDLKVNEVNCVLLTVCAKF